MAAQMYGNTSWHAALILLLPKPDNITNDRSMDKPDYAI